MSRWVAGLLVALTALTLLTVDASFASAAVRPGSLTVRLVGLPSGQPSAAVLRGPGGLRRSVSLRGLTIAKARVGVYRLTMGSVRITRATGAVKRGALATALHGTVSVRVVAGRHASLEGDYSSIINPGLKALTGGVVSIAGPATDPSSVTVKGHVALTRGDVLSLPPNAMLPDGLLSNVLGVSYASGETKVSVAAASVYEVAPNFQFDAPLAEQSPATVADVQAGCGGPSGILPYVAIKDVSFSGGWDTVKVFGLHLTDGVQAAVHFTAGAGVNVTAGVGLSCTLSVSFSANGMAGPIPVTAGIEGDLDGSAGVGGVLTTGGSIHVDAGAHTIGVPPALVWLPDVSFSDPQFTFTATTFAQATAGIGLAIKAGVGNSDIASVTLNVGASLDFDAQPGACTWDAKFGQFSAEGTLLGWSISTPQTPALFTDPLWQSACGGGSGTPGSGGSGSGGPGTGGSGASVTVTNPGNQTGTVGTPASLQIQASDSDSGALTYSGATLPAGLTLNATTGLITGTPTSTGTASVTIMATDATGPANSTTFNWTITSGPATCTVGGAASTGSVRQVPGSLWTVPSQASDIVIGPNCAVADGCEEFASSGGVTWNLSPADTNCGASVTDAAGNTYVSFLNNSNSVMFASISATGVVRWVTAGAPLNATDLGDPGGVRPVLGADGEVYFPAGVSTAVQEVVALNELTGAAAWTQSVGDSDDGIYAYSGGIAVAGPGSVEYFGYDHQLEHQYADAATGIEQSYSSAGGANGEVFLVGYSSDCAHVNVEAVTPTGEAWSWVDSSSLDCNGTLLTATPDGGVVLAYSTGLTSGVFESIAQQGSSATGAVRWSDPVSDAEQANLYVPVADTAGNVALPTSFTFPCSSNAGGSCSGASVAFVSQTTGATSLPSLTVTDAGAASGFYGLTNLEAYAVAGGAGRIYLQGQDGSDPTTLAAFSVPGFQDDYRLTLQENLTGA